MVFMFISTVASSGKTFAIVGEAATLVKSGEYVLIIQPTKELIDKTAEQIRDRFLNVQVKVIHGGTILEGKVTGQVQKYLNDPNPDPHILIVTWPAFLALGYFNRKQDWHVFVDEAPPAFVMFEKALPDTHSLLTDHLTTESCGPSYSRLLVGNEGAVRAVAENRNKDEGRALVTDLARRLISDKWDTYVLSAQYQDLISRRGKNRWLTAFSVLRPSVLSGFRSVTLAGAKIEETDLFKIWSKRPVKFQEAQALKAKLRYHEHTNGHLVTIYYGVERDWSKSLRDKENSPRPHMIEAAMTIFKQTPFLWVENKDVADHSPFSGLSHAIRLPGVPHGLNDYQNINNVVFLSALNHTPAARSFLRDFLLIDENEQRTAMNYHAIYQAVCRCSIRDPDNTEPKTIIVPDRGSAEYLCSVFPGSTIKSLGIEEPDLKKAGRPKKHNSGAERQRVHRERTREKAIQSLRSIDLARVNVSGVAYLDLCNKTTLEIKGNFVTRHLGTVYGQRTDEVGTVLVGGPREFNEFLKVCHERRLTSKDDNILISPAMCDPELSAETGRGLDNVIEASGIWLDVEDGNMTHNDFSLMFPHLEMILFNSFSHTRSKPRWRVYIPTTRNMSKDAYQIIAQGIRKTVISNGYKLGKIDHSNPHLLAHGIDNKLNPSDLFYLPCQAADPKDSFFRHLTKRKEAARSRGMVTLWPDP